MLGVLLALNVYLSGYCAAWCLDRSYESGEATKAGCRCYDEFEEAITRAAPLAGSIRRNADQPSLSTEAKTIDFNDYKTDYYTRKYADE